MVPIALRQKVVPKSTTTRVQSKQRTLVKKDVTKPKGLSSVTTNSRNGEQATLKRSEQRGLDDSDSRRRLMTQFDKLLVDEYDPFKPNDYETVCQVRRQVKAHPD